MLEFRPVRLDDQDFAKTVICSSGCHGADYSFANLYIWRHAYEPEIAFIGERMIIRMPKYGYIFAYPKGSGDVKPIIDELLEDAHSRDQKLIMRGLTPKTLEEFEPVYGDR